MELARPTARFGICIVACGFFAVAPVCAAAPAPTESRPASSPASVGAAGGIYVTTLPAGADIWLDGIYVGRAPVLVDALAPGRHALTITRTGWLVQEVDVTVPVGQVVMSSTRLVAGPRAFGAGTPSGSVVIRGAPPGATLTIDDEPADAAPGRTTELTAGVHRVCIITAKGRSTRTFTVLPNTVTDLVLQPERVVAEVHSGVVAPADDYIGADAYRVEGRRIVVRTNGHTVVARFGETAVRYDSATISYDAAPTTIGGRLYLPLALLEKLSDDMSNTR